MTQQILPPMPGAYEFMFKTPLYDRFSIPSVEQLHELLYFKSRFQAFCIYCEAQTAFGRTSGDPAEWPHNIEVLTKKPVDSLRSVSVACLLENHSHLFTFSIAGSTIVKYGQLPSLADLSRPEIRRYRAILGSDRAAELNRADGLAAHGVGIGSFVYLRRIFESLIRDAKGRAASLPDFDHEAYGALQRMDERILFLRDYLPTFLVDNRAVYGILSKGIHELSEQDCLTTYEVVRTGIELMLDALLEEDERAKRHAAAKARIAEIAGNLRSSSAR